jgi:response regulator RpfG family c-di-GMP phosphodiesterase
MTEITAEITASEPKLPIILCVDDEPNILSSLRRLFRPKGFQILVADSGKAGLAVLEAETVDLVISDMRMPEMNGAQFLEHVRQRWPDTVRLLLTGHSDVTAIIDAINRGEIYRYITKPWDDNDIVLIVRQALERKAMELETKRLEALTAKQNDELKDLNASLEAKVEARTAEIQAANERLKSSFVTSIKVFSTLIEMRGGNLSGHSRRVADLCRKIAHKLQLETKLKQEIFVAALLHEIGKIGFADDMLSTPLSKMKPDQLEAYRKHAAHAEQLLLPLQDLHGASEIISAQFERFDGTGFPDHLAGELIPIGTRILSLASDYDNMQIGMQTQSRLSPHEARVIISHGSGSRYDPKVVAAFVETISDASQKVSGVADRPVKSEEMEIGMVLSRDLITPSGLLMLSSGHVLDARVIVRIKNFERTGGLELTVYVRQNP